MKYYCPNCKSKEIIEYGNIVYCSECNLEYNKDSIGTIKDSNVVSNQELNGFLDAFDELKDPIKLKEFLRTIDEDLNDLENINKKKKKYKELIFIPFLLINKFFHWCAIISFLSSSIYGFS